MRAWHVLCVLSAAAGCGDGAAPSSQHSMDAAITVDASDDVATPVNWEEGDDVIISPAIKDEAELKAKFPKGYTVVRPYLRVTPQPNK